MEKILATQEEMYAVYEAPHKFYKLQVFLNCITEEQLEELNYEKNKGGQ